MLVVKIELWPGGHESRKKTLGTGYIVNTGKGTLTRGEYKFILKDKADKLWRHGEVKNFARKRWLAWDLLFLGLREILEVRHGPRERVSAEDHSSPATAGCDCGGEHGLTGDS